MLSLRRHILLFIYLTLSLFPFVAAKANETGSAMNLISVTDGLAGESAGAMFTDHHGQVWVCTGHGVSVFNGRRIVSYRTGKEIPASGGVNDITETADGTIYLVTRDGLMELKPKDKAFEKIFPEIKNPLSILRDGQTFYVGCDDGLAVIEGGKATIVTTGTARVSIENSVRGICKAPDGDILFLNRYVLNRYSPKTRRVTERRELSKLVPQKTSFHKVAAYKDKVYLATKSNGLYVYHLPSGRMTNVEGIGYIISSIQLHTDGTLLVGTDGTGAYRLDCATDKIVRHYGTDEPAERRLPSNVVYSYNDFGNGMEWFGLSRYGLCYTYNVTPIFAPYSTPTFSTHGKNVRSFLRHGHQTLIGMMGELVFYDSQTGQTRLFTASDMGGANIITTLQHFDGEYYIGTYDGGLHILDPRTLTFKRQTVDPLLDHCTVGGLAISPDGSLWIGSSEGLFILDRNGHSRRFTEQNSKVCGGLVRSIEFTSDGNAWLTASKGLSIYVGASGYFENSNFPEGFFNQQGTLRLAQTSGGDILASAGAKIWKSNLAMDKFEEISIPKGIAEERFYAMADDWHGHYWLATEHGVFRTDYEFGGVMPFGHSTGLTATFVNTLEADKDGTVWVCSSDGLMRTDTKRLAQWTKETSLRLMLYSIRLDGTPLTERREALVDDQGELTIRWNIVSDELRLQPVALDFAKPGGRLYEYRVDGDKEWTLLDDGADIVMNGLLLGRHELTVRLAGMERTERTWRVYVTPSPMAYAECLILIVGAILLTLWRRYHLNTRVLLRERDQMEEALIEAEKEQEQLQEAEEVTLDAPTAEGGNADEPQKYQRVKLDEDECADIERRLRDYLEREHAYRNPDLKRNDIAEALHISTVKLSQVFTLHLGENYYEFINRYRLEEFKRLIDEGEYTRYTITALSERCGFKKSSFFSTFRRVEGMTPTEYLKAKNIKVLAN